MTVSIDIAKCESPCTVHPSSKRWSGHDLPFSQPKARPSEALCAFIPGQSCQNHSSTAVPSPPNHSCNIVRDRHSLADGKTGKPAFAIGPKNSGRAAATSSDDEVFEAVPVKVKPGNS